MNGETDWSAGEIKSRMITRKKTLNLHRREGLGFAEGGVVGRGAQMGVMESQGGRSPNLGGAKENTNTEEVGPILFLR